MCMCTYSKKFFTTVSNVCLETERLKVSHRTYVGYSCVLLNRQTKFVGVR